MKITIQELVDLKKEIAEYLESKGFMKISVRNWANSEARLMVFNCPHPCLKIMTSDMAKDGRTVSRIYVPNPQKEWGDELPPGLTHPSEVLEALKETIEKYVPN